jgi:hypothetical protein
VAAGEGTAPATTVGRGVTLPVTVLPNKLTCLTLFGLYDIACIIYLLTL